MKVTAIMATCGRHYCAERSLSLFLNQEYQNKHLLIYQNSDVPQKLDADIDTSLVTLINNHIDTKTKRRYSSLGAIYNDAIKYIPNDSDVIVFWDDDDIFFEDHITEGVNGLIRGGKTAYKPALSYFRYVDGISRVSNIFEPSIFIKADHIKKFGFSNTTTHQHLQWLDPLIIKNDIFIDENGKSTLVYNWGDTFYTYKTSGNASNENHFSEYRKHSIDHGDGVLSIVDISGKL